MALRKPKNPHADTPIVIAITSAAIDVGDVARVVTPGMRLRGTDPLVESNPQYFVSADATTDERRLAEAELWPDGSEVSQDAPAGYDQRPHSTIDVDRPGRMPFYA